MRSTFLGVNQSTFKRRLAGGFPGALSYRNDCAVFCVFHAGSKRQAGWIMRFKSCKEFVGDGLKAFARAGRAA